MTYKVINDFRDQDNDYFHYKKGDNYPNGDYKPEKKRVDSLLAVHPKYKKAFIEAEIEEPEETEETEGIEKNEKIEEVEQVEESKQKKDKKPKSKE